MISLNWVKDYIDIEDQDVYELASSITKAGINVEQVISRDIKGLVIGEIKSVEDHPDSDHLHICMVDVGTDTLQIICGAHNVREKLKVIVALPGSILPGDFEIKKSKIRGVESNGMICALFELGLEEKTDETYAKGITELSNDAPVGGNPISYLGLDDTLYDLDVHKHRNNDCYYHIGFAYEIAAILNRKVKLPSVDFKTIKEDIKSNFNLKVDTKKCSYYTARLVRDVTIGESPEFIQKRLIAAGMRPINNVVDISNYVMLEFGQPLHFFDYNKLGDEIVVRDAKENEEIITLDGEKRILSSDDIVITDGKVPVCIAGVMGGANTEVDDNTKNILIESAIFDPVAIRLTSSKLNLKSEASIRYGKGLNYEYTELASKRACHLLEKYAGAKICSGEIIYDKENHDKKEIKFTTSEICTILGMNISDSDVKKELERLDFKYKNTGDKFVVEIPRRRLDIDPYVNDIAEEIGRLYGYNNLENTQPNVEIRRGRYIGDVKYRKMISKRLRSLGLDQVMNYTLVSPDMAKMFNYENKESLVLPNPMSVDKSILRLSLIPSLINNYNYNRARGVSDINIYEISKVYDAKYDEETKICGLMSGKYLDNTWKGNSEVDFYLVKGVVEDLINYMGYAGRYSFIPSSYDDFHPYIQADIVLDGKKIGVIGKIHPRLLKEDVYSFEMNLSSLIGKTPKLKFIEAYKYPSIEKDMAFIFNKDVMVGDVIKTIYKTANKLLRDVKVFDVYEGTNIDKNKKSVAFNLLFNGIDHTLTDDEVTIQFNKIIKDVENLYKAKLRDK